MKYLLLFTTLIFASEMEVDGDLKVTGTVDASGNPITNVGAPQNLTDAVNAGILASALSDGGYEYRIRLLLLRISGVSATEIEQQSSFFYKMEELENNQFSLSLFHDEFSLLINDDWMLDSINPGVAANNVNQSWWIFKRPISEDGE